MPSRRGFVLSAASFAALGLAGCRRGRAQAQAPTPRFAPWSAPTPARGKTILVLGGTGFLGPHFVRSALARGHVPTLLNRGKTNPHLFPELEKIVGDRQGDLAALRAQVHEGRRWDAVVDTSGHVPRIVGASASLLAAASEQYLFVSSISVYQDPGKHGLTEADPVGTLEDSSLEDITERSYGPLKALCEQAAEQQFPGRATNIRPGLIVGPGDPSDRYTYWPVRVAEGGRMIAPGRPDDPVQLVDVRDLGEWMVECIERRHVGVFNATGPERRLSIAQLLDACARAAQSTPELVWIDAAFLERHEVQPWMHMTVWVPPDSESGGMGSVANAKAIAAGLRFRPHVETARDTLAWWRELPAERRAEPRAGLARARETEVLAAWEAGAKTKTSA